MPQDSDVILERMRAGFRPNPQTPPEHRVPNAVEYIAVHAGDISKSLARIADALEKIAEK